MRGGAGISCVVNGAAGRETLFADAKPPQGQRIAVIGAGPAGLTYASLVADGNAVTVFERAERAGGAFRYAGLAPMFQDVEANPASLARYVDDMVAGCRNKRVTFRFDTDIADRPDLLAPFDRIVIATGATYPLGTGPLTMRLLERGAGRWPAVSWLMKSPRVRNWFYYRARHPTGHRFAKLAKPGQTVTVIGDAAQPGKSKEAIASAFEAALLGR
jgi:threonine dehydrogenase-like Zn-dependent dehydrogenase